MPGSSRADPHTGAAAETAGRGAAEVGAADVAAADVVAKAGPGPAARAQTAAAPETASTKREPRLLTTISCCLPHPLSLLRVIMLLLSVPGCGGIVDLADVDFYVLARQAQASSTLAAVVRAAVAMAVRGMAKD